MKTWCRWCRSPRGPLTNYRGERRPELVCPHCDFPCTAKPCPVGICRVHPLDGLHE